MTKRSYALQPAIADFLALSCQHFGLPSITATRQPALPPRRLNRHLACLLLAGTFGAMAGPALADEDADGLPDTPQMRIARDAEFPHQ